MGKKVTRLYEQFQPEHYQLQLEVNDEKMTFSGTVSIKGKKTGRPSQRLTFHQKGLRITEARVTKKDKNGDNTIEVVRINNQNTLDEVRLHTADKITAGNYFIVMEFQGEITRPMKGIYPCFFEHDGQQKKLIATQFESHHAREAFPCIDEPEAKATFDLALVTPEANSKTVIANTPVRWSETEDSKVTTVFETTPRMSTYLLAFVYGEMDSLEATTKDGILVRTFATPDNIKHTEFALDVAVKALEFYNEYFDIKYPLSKCDFVALPDFAAGAMENWGCITFREQALLVDPDNTSLHLKQYVANVIAHELTHQWFGDLVTMRWWTDLWLNESFASWMSYLAVDKLFPEWKVWTQFIVDEQSLALKLDALENTHPIQVEVNHPDDITAIFDAISYEKGASVLLMLQNYLGADGFRDGLRLYLERHAYGNTDSTDLWKAWEEVTKKPVSDFMEAWTSKPGYPIIKATDGKLSQERFYLNPEAKKEADVWPIPLLPSQELQAETLDKAVQEIAIPEGEVLNHDRTSFFRVIYDHKHVLGLAAAVKEGRLNELDRLGILADGFEAAKAGYGSTTDILELLEAYADEDSAVVWDVIAGGIGSIRAVMDDDEIRKHLKPYVRKLVAKQLGRLGWEPKDTDSHFDKLLRPTILGLASYGEDPDVVAEAQRRFETMSRPEDIHPDLRGIVYGTVARNGGQAEFDKLLKMHNETKNSEEKVTLGSALTGFEQPELINKALAEITGDNVRLQDAAYWIVYSFANRHARRIAWQWLQDNWSWLEKNLGSDHSYFRMPLYAGRYFSDASFLPEFKAFFELHMTPGFERPVKQAVETIEWQSAWKQRDLEAIKKFLAN